MEDGDGLGGVYLGLSGDLDPSHLFGACQHRHVQMCVHT